MIVSAFMSFTNCVSALKCVNSHRVLWMWEITVHVVVYGNRNRAAVSKILPQDVFRMMKQRVVSRVVLEGWSFQFFPSQFETRKVMMNGFTAPTANFPESFQKLRREFRRWSGSRSVRVPFIINQGRPANFPCDSRHDRCVAAAVAAAAAPPPHVIKHPNVRYVKTLIAFRPRQIAGGTNVRYY